PPLLLLLLLPCCSLNLLSPLPPSLSHSLSSLSQPVLERLEQWSMNPRMFVLSVVGRAQALETFEWAFQLHQSALLHAPSAPLYFQAAQLAVALARLHSNNNKGNNNDNNSSETATGAAAGLWNRAGQLFSAAIK